ncbi:MAG: nicotinate-nucleotide--dimethylbenzimidazole phosphoribosyltransferase [Heliobacteriaceae bacterium]|nr:nicotinate-nucleotide--dimethylbenzimidazole phosphoribosyltransferase [Heliobacteriaceae bacterium]
MIKPLDQEAMAAARRRWDSLIKPPQGLAALEDFVVHLAGITGQAVPALNRRRALIIVADHGVAVEGVSAYPPGMTAEIVNAFLNGQSGTAVLGRETGTEIFVIDVGLQAGYLPVCRYSPSGGAGLPVFQGRKIAPGTRNFLFEPALTPAEVTAALDTGAALVREAIAAGIEGLALGEIGIGNTTACSAVVAALLDLPPGLVVGRGSGVAAGTLVKKKRVVEQALARHRPAPDDPLGVLAAVGGLEVAVLTGAVLAAAGERLPVVLDGFVTCTAALCATKLAPQVRNYLLPSHRSREAGQQKILEYLGLRPLLAFDLQYGEGVGAVLALHQAYLATCVLRDMGFWREKEEK